VNHGVEMIQVSVENDRFTLPVKSRCVHMPRVAPPVEFVCCVPHRHA
jgi:hypothetical protein